MRLKCEECGKIITTDTEKCPYCDGELAEMPAISPKFLIWVCVIFIVFIVGLKFALDIYNDSLAP